MRLLLVEDDTELAESLADGLHREGYAVTVARDGAEALTAIATESPELPVLDRDLPVLHGDQVCRVIRAEHLPVRILVLTAADRIEDRVAGLDVGADDYLGKPFAYAELLARLRSLARRDGDAADRESDLVVGEVVLDRRGGRARRGGCDLRLTARELELLECLMTEAGRYLSSDVLLDRVWDRTDRDAGVVKATVHTLRRKLGEPSLIETAPGLGYRFVDRADADAPVAGVRHAGAPDAGACSPAPAPAASLASLPGTGGLRQGVRP